MSANPDLGFVDAPAKKLPNDLNDNHRATEISIDDI